MENNNTANKEELNYKTVLKLAQNKGYDPVVVFVAKYGGSATLPHHIIDTATRLCELTLIQKWLRDEHTIEVLHNSDKILTSKRADYYFSISRCSLEKITISHHIYEVALLKGINEALSLIK